MAFTYLQAEGLPDGHRSWFYNRLGAVVPILPGDWLKVDLDDHPELSDLVERGVLVPRTDLPSGVAPLTASTRPDLVLRRHGPEPSPRYRKRSREYPDVHELSIKQLQQVAREWMWPEGKGFKVPAGATYHRARDTERGEPHAASCHPIFFGNVAILCRLAELIADQEYLRERRQYQRAQARGEVHLKPLPSREERRGQLLLEWKVFPKAPSRATVKRYRDRLGEGGAEGLDLTILETAAGLSAT